MRHRLLVIIILLVCACNIAYAQTSPHVLFSASKHHVCPNEEIEFNDQSVNVNPVGRCWIFPDTTIRGTFGGDQVTVYRDFTNDTNPIEFKVFHAYTDTIVSPANDTAYATKYDTLVYHDTIYVFHHPEFAIKGDSVVCPNDSTDIRLKNIANGCIYSWHTSLGATTDPIATGPRLQMKPYNDEAIYYVKIVSPEGCVQWHDVRTYVLRSSLVSIPADGEVCQYAETRLIANKADHYLWESIPIDTTLKEMTNSQQVVTHPASTTVYYMTPFASNGCKGEKMQVVVKVHPLPVPKVKLSPHFIDPTNPKLTLYDLSENSVSSFWTFGSNETAEGKSVEHFFESLPYDSTTIVLRTTNDLGCHVDTTMRVAVQQLASWAPNIFTPNRAENNTFSIYTANELEYFTVHIYNRRGALVFYSTDPQFAWDGTHSGKDCPQGAYVYRCSYRRAGTDELVDKLGTILLIR